jgi:hypothetical protein
MTNTTILTNLTDATFPVQKALFDIVEDLAPPTRFSAVRLRRALIDAESAYVRALSDAENFLSEYGVEL